MGRPRGHKFDAIDTKIIKELQKKPDLSYSELGKLVNLTYTPCRLRVKRLFKNGHIESSVLIKRESFKRESSSGKKEFCVLVKLHNTSQQSIEFFSSVAQQMSEVDLCWELEGQWDFVIRLSLDKKANFKIVRENLNGIEFEGKQLILRTQSSPIVLVVKDTADSMI